MSIPSYRRRDPTPFSPFLILLFGAMFGDIGQGLVILLTGLFISIRTKNKSFGGILSRLGASSMIFSVLYGSIFGSEEIIPAILIETYSKYKYYAFGSCGIWSNSNYNRLLFKFPESFQVQRH